MRRTGWSRLRTPGGAARGRSSYTNNGDLSTKDERVQAYAFDYDLSSNLRSVQVSGAGAAGVDYVIDGMNRRDRQEVATTRVGDVNEGLLYDEQGRVVAELDGSNNVLSTFVYGLKPNVPDYMVRGGVAYRIVSDWRGDVRLVLDTTKTGAAAVVRADGLRRVGKRRRTSSTRAARSVGLRCASSPSALRVASGT